MILPCVLFTRKFWSSGQAKDICFWAATFGAMLLSIGAMGIGLAQEQTELLGGNRSGQYAHAGHV